jgi:hypothetical protein
MESPRVKEAEELARLLALWGADEKAARIKALQVVYEKEPILSTDLSWGIPQGKPSA